jgi:hypothetical protein
MSSKSNRFRPTLDALEDRCLLSASAAGHHHPHPVHHAHAKHHAARHHGRHTNAAAAGRLADDPAIIHFVASDLLISPGPSEPGLSLVIRQTAANTFSVSDQGQSLGTFGAVGTIVVNGGNGADAVTLDLNGRAYTGSFYALTRNGNDTITVTDGVAAGASIGGNVTVVTGLGNDVVNVGSTSAGPLLVGGFVNVSGNGGLKRFSLGNAANPTTVGGDLSVTGFTTINLGAGQADRVGGNVTLQSILTTANDRVTLADNLTVGKNLTFSGGPGADVVSLGNVTVLGGLFLNLGEGNNTVMSASAATVFTVGGNLEITAGSGTNTIAFPANNSAAGPLPTIDGTLDVLVGDGNTTLFGPGQFFHVLGDMNVQAGGGNDTAPGLDALVDGNLRITLGNGADNFTLATSPFGQLYWRSGNGADTLTLGSAGSLLGSNPFLSVNLTFGTNDDTVNVDIGAAGSITGRIDGGNHLTTNTFNQVSGTIVEPFQLINFP